MDCDEWTAEAAFELDCLRAAEGTGSPAQRTETPHDDEDDEGPGLWDESLSADFDPNAPVVFGDDLIADVLPEFGVGLITGASGAFKTFGSLELCFAVATKHDFAGYAVERQGGAVYLAFEAWETIQGRLMAAYLDKGLRAREMPIRFPKSPARFNVASAYAELERSLRRTDRDFRRKYGLPLVLVVIDTAAAAGLVADEMDAGQWQAMVSSLKDIAERLRICIAVATHAGKDATKGARGSSASYAAVDFEISFSAARDRVTGEVAGRLMSLTKSREGNSFPMAAMSGQTHYVGKTERGKHKHVLAIRFDTSQEAIDRAIDEQRAAAGQGGGGTSRTDTGQDDVRSENERLLLDAIFYLVDTPDSGRWPDTGDEVEPFFAPDALTREAFMRAKGITETSGKRERDAARKAWKRAIDAAVAKKLVVHDGGAFKILKRQ